MRKLQIEQLSVHALQPYARNARTHSRRQIKQIANSIRKFGFCNPILIGDDLQIIAGHGRVEAAKLLGFEVVPAVRLSHLSATERRAYVLADNRLAELAGWDREVLAIELQGLIDLDFDVELTGFETPAIDLILEEEAERKLEAGPEDDVPEIVNGPPVTRPGDIWVLGEHRLLCNDARVEQAYETLLGEDQADLVITDPPYNVRIEGNVSGKGRIVHGEFAMASGEMSEAEFIEFLKTTLGCAARVSRDGALHYVCMDWRHAYEILRAGREVYGQFLNLCVWAKDNGGMGSFYRSRHELVFVFKVGTAPHVNNVELGRHGRNRTNVWEYAGVNTLRKGRLEELAMHPTVKPVALIADAIKDCTRRNALVLDPFAGSGTILIAAEKTGRQARAMEIDPRYVDVAVRRWESYAGKNARLGERGNTFEEVAASEARRSIWWSLPASPPSRLQHWGNDMTQEIDDKSKPKQPRRKRTPPPGATYEVGYARTPEHGKFQKGQTGNPMGRPKRSRNFFTLVKERLQEIVTVNVGGKPQKMSRREVIIARLINKAMEGDWKAADKVIGMEEKHGLLEPEPGTSGVLILPASVGPEEYHRLYGKAAQGAPVPQEIKDMLQKLKRRHDGN